MEQVVEIVDVDNENDKIDCKRNHMGCVESNENNRMHSYSNKVLQVYDDFK